MNVYKLETFLRTNNLFRLLQHTQTSNEPHSHNFFELAYIIDGECTHVLNGTHTRLHPGDYVIIDFNSVHHYICDNNKPITLIDCLFVPEFIDQSYQNCNSFKNLISSYQIGIDYHLLKFNPNEYTFHDTNGYIKQLLMIMIYEYNNLKIASFDIARHCLSQILLMTLREISDSNINQTSELIRYIFDACQNRYNEKKLLDSICKELHYSKPYISAKFKKELKKNFKDYLVETRIDNACRLLTTTNKKVNEIASLVGYDDVTFFISTFKNKTNLTPTQFRKTVRETRASM